MARTQACTDTRAQQHEGMSDKFACCARPADREKLQSGRRTGCSHAPQRLGARWASGNYSRIFNRLRGICPPEHRRGCEPDRRGGADGGHPPAEARSFRALFRRRGRPRPSVSVRRGSSAPMRTTRHHPEKPGSEPRRVPGATGVPLRVAIRPRVASACPPRCLQVILPAAGRADKEGIRMSNATPAHIAEASFTGSNAAGRRSVMGSPTTRAAESRWPSAGATAKKMARARSARASLAPAA
jgi:hypothetical protein